MKLFYLIITLLTFGLIRTSLVSPSNSVFGPCQKRCISRFVESEERVTNIDTTYRVIDVLNNTDFALCRLGCTNPGYSDLNLPSFNYGQSAYTEIRTSKNPSLFRESVVDSVDILCLDRINEQLIGKVVMVLDDGVDPMESIHLMEIIALDSADVDNSLVFQDFCYNLRCDVSFKFNVSSFTEIRLRVTTYDDNAVIGRPILSRRYDLEKALRTEFNSMQLVDVDWNEDKAAARFILDESGNSYIPKCSFQVNYKNTTNSTYESVDMYLDQTREILVKNLNFNQNYTMSLIGDPENSDDAVEINVPKCSEMVDDMSMCAPPPVSSISSHWNISTTHDSRLIIDWSYYSVLDESIDLTSNAIRTSHFLLSVRPLITENNEKCQQYESIVKVASVSYRKFIFNVPDSKCNYEVGVTVFDTKRRKSLSRKITISRSNQPSFLALLPSNDIQITIGLIALLISIVISLLLILLFCHLKRKNRSLTLNRKKKGTVVYAYVDEATRNITGVRAPGHRFVPIGNTNRDVEASIAQQSNNYTLHDGNKGTIFHNQFVNQLQYPVSESITPRPYGDIGAENPYDYIMDFHMDSELSDDVFEEEISLNTPIPSIRPCDSPAYSPMPPIAPFNSSDNLPAFAHRNFRFGKSYEPEGSSFCRMKTAVDLSRGHCYSLKYPKDYSDMSRKALCKELEILRTIPFYPNCVRFDGVIIGRWGNIPFQITGILLEDCRGGSLHNYIKAVGSILRDRDLRTPDDPAHPSTYTSPNLSSGYDSFITNGRQTPEGQRDTERVSTAFRRFAEQISGALEHLHRTGILHTRVTTMSMYLSLDYNDPLDEVLANQNVKLGDFGNSSRSSGNVILDPNVHSPPEIILGKKYGPKGDVWQFGTCLVELSSLGFPYKVKEEIPISGNVEFDNLPSTILIRNAAKKCLKLRSRPKASTLRSMFMENL